MRRKSKVAFYLYLAGLFLVTIACSIAGINPAVKPTPTAFVLPTASGPTATPDPARADTYLGDYVAQNGLFFAALEVQDPAKAEMGANIRPGTQTMPAKVVIAN